MSFQIEHLSPVLLRVTGGVDLFEWRDRLKKKVPGHEYTPRFKKGQWDGYWRPGKWCRKIKGAHHHGDTRPRSEQWEMEISRGMLHRLTELPPPLLSMEELQLVAGMSLVASDLRDYQKRAFLQVLLHKWGRVDLATNAGKGAVIALLCRILAAQNKRVLILCDELAVMEALEGELLIWAETLPGKVEAGVKSPPPDMIVLAMVPSLARHLGALDRARKALRKAIDENKDQFSPEIEELKEKLVGAQAHSQIWKEFCGSFSGLLLDEADKATAATWKRILSACINSEIRAGFSGTFPEDVYGDLLLDDLMGPILITAKNKEMIERGISAKPLVLLRKFDCSDCLDAQPRGFRRWKGAQKRAWIYDAAITGNHARHQFIASLIREDVPTCIIVNRIQHGEWIEAAIKGSVFLDGSASKKLRDEVLSSFAHGDFRVLVTTKILDRGTNRLGHAVDLIFASGEGSRRQSLQRIGRGLRKAEKKEFLILTDIIDTGHKYLHTAGKKRIALYHAEGFDVEVME